MGVKTMKISTAVTLLSLACACLAAAAATTTNQDRRTATAVPGDGCSHLTTCVNCTQKPEAACTWSVARQACVATSTMPEGPTAANASDCPRVRVARRIVTTEEFEYRVRVADDRIGMATYLRDHAGAVKCVWETGVVSDGHVTVDPDFDGLGGHGGYVTCDPVRRDRFSPDRHLPIVRHFRVTLGGNVTLRMDNETDYYTGFYRNNCGGKLNDRCVECAWTDDARRYYLKACSSANVCAVQPSMKLVYVNSQYLKYRGGRRDLDLDWPSDTRTRCDRDIAVTSFEPTRLPWNADESTVIQVRVKNMSVLAERFFVWDVSVAGRECTDPLLRIENGGATDVLTCRLSAERRPTAVATGPVRVRFASPSAAAAALGGAAPAPGGTTFVVESADRFRFDGPAPKSGSGPRCGSLRGGDVLTVHGTGFEYSGNVTAHVNRARADGKPSWPRVPCNVTGRAKYRVTCVTGPSDAPTQPGPLTLTFDGGLTLAVPAFEYAYVSDPVLLTSQTLQGIVDGGTTVQVHWRGIECTAEGSVRLYVHRHNDARRFYSDCVMVDATLTVCRSPTVTDDAPATSPAPGTWFPEDRDADTSAVERFECGFEMRFAGHMFYVACGPTIAYYAYSNPAYSGFYVGPGGTSVVIVGRDSGLGYEPADVTVLLPLREPATCKIWLVDRDRTECLPPDNVRGSPGLMLLDEIWVTVGSAPPVVVQRLDSLRNRRSATKNK